MFRRTLARELSSDVVGGKDFVGAGVGFAVDLADVCVGVATVRGVVCFVDGWLVARVVEPRRSSSIARGRSGGM